MTGWKIGIYGPPPGVDSDGDVVTPPAEQLIEQEMIAQQEKWASQNPSDHMLPGPSESDT